jgi:broad specificity phosphatase PhoE
LLWSILGFDSSFLWRIRIANTSVTRLIWASRGWFVDEINQTHHLVGPDPFAPP